MAASIDTQIYSAMSSAGHAAFKLRMQQEIGHLDLTRSQLEEVSATGYWLFTKMITDTALDAYEQSRSSSGFGFDNSSPSPPEPGENFWLSGYSQGGSRAALASMYLEKSRNEKYQTITFAATGGTCFSRRLDNDANFLQDLNPYKVHPQITDYVHPLDFFGNLDYDPGQTCLYGVDGLKQSPSYQYCKKIFRNNIESFLVSQTKTMHWHEDLHMEFERCQYFTHFIYSLHSYLNEDGIIDEYGSTDGGCSSQAIPVSDRDQRCPTRDHPSEGCSTHKTCKTCHAGDGCKWCHGHNACMSSFDHYWGCNDWFRDMC